jgi:type II secretory pathway component PulC
MHVVVPRDREIRWDPKPINALAVSVDDPEGYLARAGFRTGDLVVGINGTAFTDMLQMQGVFMSAMGKEEARLTVLRGGAELELTINPQKIMKQDNLGGEFEPSSR